MTRSTARSGYHRTDQEGFQLSPECRAKGPPAVASAAGCRPNGPRMARRVRAGKARRVARRMRASSLSAHGRAVSEPPERARVPAGQDARRARHPGCAFFGYFLCTSTAPQERREQRSWPRRGGGQDARSKESDTLGRRPSGSCVLGRRPSASCVLDRRPSGSLGSGCHQPDQDGFQLSPDDDQQGPPAAAKHRGVLVNRRGCPMSLR